MPDAAGVAALRGWFQRGGFDLPVFVERCRQGDVAPAFPEPGNSGGIRKVRGITKCTQGDLVLDGRQFIGSKLHVRFGNRDVQHLPAPDSFICEGDPQLLTVDLDAGYPGD